jgi:hypothetical protein
VAPIALTCTIRVPRGGQAAGQRHVHALELGLAAVQRGDEVHHQLGAVDQPGQCVVVVHVGFHHVHERQRPQGGRVGPAPRGHQQPWGTCRPAGLVQPLGQGPADEAAAPEDELVCHDDAPGALKAARCPPAGR